MSCEEAWRKVHELREIAKEAFSREMELHPRPGIGEAVAMSDEETKAFRQAQETRRDAFAAVDEAAIRALRLNAIH